MGWLALLFYYEKIKCTQNVRKKNYFKKVLKV